MKGGVEQVSDWDEADRVEGLTMSCAAVKIGCSMQSQGKDGGSVRYRMMVGVDAKQDARRTPCRRKGEL